GDPGRQRAPLRFVSVQCPVHLDKDFLCQVLCIVSCANEAVTDVVNPPMIALHNFFPGSSVAAYATAHQRGDDLGVFQTALPGTSGLFSRKRRPLNTPPPKPDTTLGIRYCGPKSSLFLGNRRL